MKHLTLILLLLSFNVFAETGIFDPSDKRTNGKPLPQSEIMGYQIYKDYVEYGDVIPNDIYSFPVEILPTDKLLTIVTIDTDGRRSEHSNEAELITKPNAPTNIRIIFNVDININAGE